MLSQSIQSISIVNQSNLNTCKYFYEHDYKLVLDPQVKSSRFSLKIVFKSKIISLRNSAYNWESLSGTSSCNQFSPKIIYLENKLYVQSNCSLGIWEINAKYPNELLWHFNKEHAAPLINFSGTEKFKTILDTKPENVSNTTITLLSSPFNGIELSRSAFSFSAIACFSDHCDFDTEHSLKLQREFLKSLNIIITKGIFLHHYSKREETACWENNKDEYMKWLEDGHELAYHSLSLSVKSDIESINDFLTFNPPAPNMTTWIDHGFQPYNLAQFSSERIGSSEYNKTLKNKGIKTLWNYIDSGFATTGVINQLNPNHFTLEKYWIGIRALSFNNRIRLMLKTIFTNYYSDAESKKLYVLTAKYFKVFLKKKTKKSMKIIFKNSFKILGKLFKLFLRWNTNKKRPFNLAKNTPLLFKYTIDNDTYNIFQTIEMVDFIRAFSKRSIDVLIKEKGVFIAHTYFSVPFTYHDGRLFKTPNEIDKRVSQNFSYLGAKIKSKEIWNPTVNELVEYLNRYLETEFNCNDSGEIYLTKNKDIISRKIHI